MTLYLLEGFNNYYNRVVKRYNALSEYIEWAEDTNRGIINKPNINFNPNDNVETEQIINWEYNWSPDYIIVADDNNTIVSRWFVMEAIRMRGKQYKLELRRDLIVDHYKDIITAKCFIEKANLSADDPFIFNQEDMNFNQIKTTEIPLKDKSGCAWIVGYYDYTYRDNNSPLHVELTENIAFDAEIGSSIEDWDFYKYINSNKFANVIVDGNFIQSWHYQKKSGGIFSDWDYYFSGIATNFDGISSYLYGYGGEGAQARAEEFMKNYMGSGPYGLSSRNCSKPVYADELNQVNLKFREYGMDRVLEALDSSYDFKTVGQKEELMYYNNKIVKFNSPSGSVNYYRINVQQVQDPEATYISNGISYKSIYVADDEALYEALSTIQKSMPFYEEPNVAVNPTDQYVRIRYNSYTISATLVDSGTYSVSFTATANKPVDAPYGMFAIPYPVDASYVYMIKEENGVGYKIQASSDVAMMIAQGLSTKYAAKTDTGAIYDMQLLPYCPCPEILTREDPDYYAMDIDPTKEGTLYSEITLTRTGQNDKVVGYVFYPPKSSFTNTITLKDPIVINNPKIESQTDLYRLVSPNYNGQFEFNAAKNGGVSSFDVDCTYLPYNPYIHVNPDFKLLYGGDFNDARGLICNGDFSLTMMTDRWQTYQIQNKNYQNIFNREIQNMEVQHRIADIKERFAAIAGTGQGAVAGGMMGSLGGPIGAAAGVVGGAAVSGAGGYYDLKYNRELRAEAIDFTRDQFGYQLSNIMALPQSIAKTTSLTYNNKIFPILEYYTCKDEEKLALANKIAYNGMTVMRIGQLINYIGTPWEYNVVGLGETVQTMGYIKGKIIRLDEINDDFHIASEIANEIYKGVFI